MDALELARNDLLQTAATRKKTLVVFPSGANKQQTLGIGDLSGVSQCLSIKKGECQTRFKSLPTSHRITAVALGRGKSQRDKIFIAEDAMVRGLTKKGREFFRFDTNLTESISEIVVLDTKLCIFGEYTVLTFVENKETGVYFSPDRINDAVAFLLESTLLIALACQDRKVKVLDNSTVLHQCSMQSIPTSIAVSQDTHDPTVSCSGSIELLVGTDQGQLDQLLLDSSGLHQTTLLKNEVNKGSIVALFSGIDFTKDGMSEIAVGRDDGYVEVYSIDEQGTLRQVFQTKLLERINTITGGFITSSSHQDLLVQTYSGKVIAFCPQGAGLFQLQGAGGTGTSMGSNIQTIEQAEALQKKIVELQTQIRSVSSQVEEKKTSNQSLLGMCNALRGMDISHSCRFNALENCFVLTIEVERPLFCVGLCSDIWIELLEAQNSIAILSKASCNVYQDYVVLGTYRCQDSANKLDIRFRCQEGNSGTITCFLIPKQAPRFAIPISHRILPLCLHERVSESALDLESMSNLTLKGELTGDEICLLFSSALPDFPKHWLEDQMGHLSYCCRPSGDLLGISRGDGEVVVHCKDVCALEILKNTLLQESETRNQSIQVKTQINRAAVEVSLKQLWTDLKLCRSLDEEAKIAQALLELAEQEEDLNFLEVSLRRIHVDSGKILETWKQSSGRLRALSESIVSLITHCRKLLGLTCAPTTYHELTRFLNEEDASFAALLEFLSSTTEPTNLNDTRFVCNTFQRECESRRKRAT